MSNAYDILRQRALARPLIAADGKEIGMSKSNFSRREFLEVSAAAAGGAIGARTIFLKRESEPARKTVAPSDTVRFGIIGVGMEGSGLLGTSIQLSAGECAGARDLY